MLPVIAQLGFSVVRQIPPQVLLGAATGAYKVCGGVIRDSGTGRIVAHLVEGAQLASSLNPLGLVKTAISGLNTYQLHRIGKDVFNLREDVAKLHGMTSHLLTLSQGTALLSGLTLGVTAAGFIFLSKKLNVIDKKLDALQKDVKYIRDFLKQQERARLFSILKALHDLDANPDLSVRKMELVQAKGKLLELREKYVESFSKLETFEEALAIEEYYTIISIALAMCQAELGSFSQARENLDEAVNLWSTHTRRIAKDAILKENPERFLRSKYAGVVKTEELVEWLDFAHQTERHLEWIDELRGTDSKLITLRDKRLGDEDQRKIEVIRRYVARQPILEGYQSQFEHYEKCQVRPSEARRLLQEQAADQEVEGCLVLVDPRSCGD